MSEPTDTPIPTASTDNAQPIASAAAAAPAPAQPQPDQSSSAMDVDHAVGQAPAGNEGTTEAASSGGGGADGLPDSTAEGSVGGRVEGGGEGRGAGSSRRGSYTSTKPGRKEGKNARKAKDMGRTQYSKSLEQRRPGGADERSSKRARLGDGRDENAPTTGEQEEGEKEARLPKRKVAVMIGYCGHGYKGMQLNYPLKTIEGDLFAAFVAAGAISKANSDDPKKSSLIRCARTDKGVHAAGNVISLKLIIEDPDIVKKINDNLPAQIRVWGIVRTLGSFSCYQMCDSRVYEYLIPTHVFISPHPASVLAKMLEEQAIAQDDLEGYRDRQAEVKDFWASIHEEVAALLKEYSPDNSISAADAESELANDAQQIGKAGTNPAELDPSSTIPTKGKLLPDDLKKALKALHLKHKRAFRIPPERLARVRSALQSYCGTHNFHNFTVSKNHADASAHRHIKTFDALDPILINGVEYLSLRVHGQSFMMHQIRKMVGLALLVVRCGTPIQRIRDCYSPVAVPIPKAPGLGLLLERPVFDSYNNNKCSQFQREPLDFSRYQTEIDAFRQEFIYKRMFEEEAQAGLFHEFTTFIDGYRNPAFSYLGSKGLKALEEARAMGKLGGKVGEIGPGDGEEEEEEVGAVMEG